jgi:hypothetical protein
MFNKKTLPIPFCIFSELVGVIKEKKAALPPADAEGNRPASPLDSEIAALEAVRPPLLQAMIQCCFPTSIGCILKTPG